MNYSHYNYIRWFFFFFFLDSRALSLKEKLQKWREQKQKQADLKKKQQPPAFVVKTVEHKSDLCLYGASSKNTKVIL